MNGILVLVEQRDNQVENLTWQLLGKGRQLANELGVTLSAVVIGDNTGPVVESLKNKGPDTIMVADHASLANYNAEATARILADVVAAQKPDLVLMGYTFLGMEVGPSVATRCSIPLVSNCVHMELSAARTPVVKRPMYDGMYHVTAEAAFPLIVSVQKGALASGAPSASVSTVAPIEARFDPPRTRILEILNAGTGGIDISKANIIVSVGRGIGPKANIEMANALADKLGGVIAASRPIIDLGWLPPERLVGLSGKTVSPKVYIACGISGAAQHLAGMVDSSMILAINKDLAAPIFKVAHYGIVGDLAEVLPELIKASDGMVKNA